MRAVFLYRPREISKKCKKTSTNYNTTTQAMTAQQKTDHPRPWLFIWSTLLNKTIEYLEHQAGEEDPFFAFVPFNGPYGHWPAIKGRPDFEYADLYDTADMHSIPREGLSSEVLDRFGLRVAELLISFCLLWVPYEISCFMHILNFGAKLTLPVCVGC